MLRRWLRPVALALLGLLVAAVLCGAGYEAHARRRAARDFPPPGALIDVGGRRIQLDCRGAGAPIVVFESGLDFNGSLAWSAVHDAVAKTTRACAYSRAGIMWSDPGDGPPSAPRIAEDLHAALAGAGERPPFVLVGHSLGGPYIMTYAKRFGADVAGLVFVDATHPDQAARLAAVGAGRQDPITFYRVAAALSWTGVVRAAFPRGRVPDHEPEAAARAMLAYAPTSIGAVVAETAAYDRTLAEAGTFRTLGDRPVFVLTAMPPLTAEDLAALQWTEEKGRQVQATRKSLHDDEAAWSSRSRHMVVTDSEHFIQFDRPDAVIEGVRWVVETVRGSR